MRTLVTPARRAEPALDSPPGLAARASPPQATPSGSRRRRVWELPSHAHCPVVGVCLPIPVLRRLLDKLPGSRAPADADADADAYALHCRVISECQHRSPAAEVVQRELDRRCATALREAARAKSSEALAEWWQQAASGKDLAGGLWATLSHARCNTALEARVLSDVHMLQHQVGMACRADLHQFNALVDENAVLGRELAAAQLRSARRGEQSTRRSEVQQGQIVQLRAELIGRDTTLAALRDDLQALTDAVPGLKSRFEQSREAVQQAERVLTLQRALMQARHEIERQQRRSPDASPGPELRADGLPATTATATAPMLLRATPRLDDRAVLCVGGRTASVPVYRHLVERTGGRFLHHDGGQEDGSAKLDATLAAADLVICQTGCISHDAYWRVKDHCKRTGKRCVFVESPSAAGIKRAPIELQPLFVT